MVSFNLLIHRRAHSLLDIRVLLPLIEPPMSERKYDLFISYADADRDWVEGFFIPALGIADDRIITQDKFQPGARILQAFEQAVECSRFVVIVFSPAYISDVWAVFGDELAGYASVVEQRDKLIPLVLEECPLPLHAAFRVQLNCTEQARWAAEAARLRELLGAPEPIREAVECPYPGLRPYTRENAAHFFGREAEIDELLLRLRKETFLLVLGPSGSGKSSLVLSGMVHALEQRQPGKWDIRDTRPGAHPGDALRQAVGDRVDLETGNDNRPDRPRLLLVIDQLEELFLQAAPEEQARAVEQINRLRHSAACVLVLVLRADFFGELISSALWPVDAAQRFELAPMRSDALRLAVKRPAQAVGVMVEGGLVERLVADAEGQAGALPLMQEVLSLLWNSRMERLLPFSAYLRLGEGSTSGLARAIAIHADAVFNQLAPGEQSAARRVLVRLVQFNEGRPDTRRRLVRRALMRGASDRAGWRVIQTLAEQRLLTLSGETSGSNDDPATPKNAEAEVQVDLAHEALIYAWPRLQKWIQEDRAAELTRRRLLERSQDWISLGRRGDLLDAVALEQARAWMASPAVQSLDIDDDIRAYIEASSVAQRERSRQRWLLPAAAVAGVLLLALLVWQGWRLSLQMRASSLNPPVDIPGGVITMGDADSRLDFVQQTGEFVVPGFALDAHEVTNAQYCLCRKSQACSNDPAYTTGKHVCDPDPAVALLPVTRITLADAAAFCGWLGRRVPTEIEWEWAAKGANSNRYPTGDTLPAPELININHLDEQKAEYLWPVDRFTADRLPERAVFGMAGNAREWTLSVYLPYDDPAYINTYYSDDFPGGANYVVVRGGSYAGIPEIAQSINRYKILPEEDADDLGFRCLTGLSMEEFIQEVKASSQ